MANRLAHETSPYLLQHAENPVDWWPWCDEALAASLEQEKPIFLSVGYSACHWCHVMERESFEDSRIAGELNQRFVCIKVDREERPDLDQIYMNAVQLMTGRGGWPMSVFLTPELQPFFGGTYWPPERRMGMPGFLDVVVAVDEAWTDRREQAQAQAAQLTEHLRQLGSAHGAGDLDVDLLNGAYNQLRGACDFRNGGFGQAPKFPHSMDIQLLFRIARRGGPNDAAEMAALNLHKMAAGGIYDHLAGGFARYSVDERWLVPHFEKMLYDNALLTNAYLDGFIHTGEASFARVADETITYVQTYMTDGCGAFHSTEDADSEGEEGKFYVWSPGEVAEILGEDEAEVFCYVYDVSEAGNFEGKSILNLPKSIEQCAALKGWDLAELTGRLANSRDRLLQARDQRVRPGKDDKILVSWNGLMIDALARAALILDRPDALESATRAARFIWDSMRRDDGRLLHSWRRGHARFDAYLDDYSYLLNAFVSLYESTCDESWIDRGVSLADILLEHFEDRGGDGFYFTSDDHEALIARNKDVHDASAPSGNGMAAFALLRLSRLTGDRRFEDAATGALRTGLAVMQRSPLAAAQLLNALDFLLGPADEVVLLGDRDDPATGDLLKLFSRQPGNRVVACRPLDGVGSSAHLNPVFAAKSADDEQPTAFVCRQHACQEPLVGVAAIRAKWADLGDEVALE